MPHTCIRKHPHIHMHAFIRTCIQNDRRRQRHRQRQRWKQRQRQTRSRRIHRHELRICVGAYAHAHIQIHAYTHKHTPLHAHAHANHSVFGEAGKLGMDVSGCFWHVTLQQAFWFHGPAKVFFCSKAIYPLFFFHGRALFPGLVASLNATYSLGFWWTSQAGEGLPRVPGCGQALAGAAQGPDAGGQVRLVKNKEGFQLGFPE